MFVVFFFKQKTAYEMRISDWSSDVCSSDLAGVVVQAEGVVQAQRLQAAQGVAFGGGGEDVVVVPDGRVVHVAVVGGDVEVAQHHQPRVHRDLGREPVVHGVAPAQLVGVFLGAHVLAVDHVQVDDAHAVDGGGDHPLLLVIEAGNADLHVVDRAVRSEEHTSELQSLMRISYAVFCLK